MKRLNALLYALILSVAVLFLALTPTPRESSPDERITAQLAKFRVGMLELERQVKQAKLQNPYDSLPVNLLNKLHEHQRTINAWQVSAWKIGWSLARTQTELHNIGWLYFYWQCQSFEPKIAGTL